MFVPPRRRLAAVLTGALALGVVGAAPASAATTVDLGTAGAFAVLAGSGITNTGVSTIGGDIGTSPSPAETGVAPCPTAADCVVLTGTNHPADATALTAKDDLTTAYNAAAGQPADAALAPELGGLTFTSGVYNASSSLGLTGEVTLDGQNVEGAVFIFQVGSSLVTAAGSLITLVNGANACNVFFQVGTAATLGTSSIFRGTIMAHDDISLGDGVTVQGRLLGGEQASGEGAVTLIHDTITVPSCSTGGTTGGSTGSTTGTGTSTGGTGTGTSTGGSSTGSGTSTGGDTSGTTTGGTTGSSGSTGTGTSTGAGSSGTATGGSTGGSTDSTGSSGSAGGSTGATTGETPSGLASETADESAAADSTTARELPYSGTHTGALVAFGFLLVLMGTSVLAGGRVPIPASPHVSGRHLRRR